MCIDRQARHKMAGDVSVSYLCFAVEDWACHQNDYTRTFCAFYLLARLIFGSVKRDLVRDFL